MLILGGWTIGISLAGVFAGMEFKKNATPEEPSFPDLSGHHLMSSDSINVPLIQDGQIAGYLMAKVSVMANDLAFTQKNASSNVEITDELLGYLQSGQPILSEPSFNLDAWRERFLAKLNDRAGEKVFESVLVSQLDYLSPSDIERMKDPAQAKLRSVSILGPEQLDGLPATIPQE